MSAPPCGRPHLLRAAAAGPRGTRSLLRRARRPGLHRAALPAEHCRPCHRLARRGRQLGRDHRLRAAVPPVGPALPPGDVRAAHPSAVRWAPHHDPGQAAERLGWTRPGADQWQPPHPLGAQGHDASADHRHPGAVHRARAAVRPRPSGQHDPRTRREPAPPRPRPSPARPTTALSTTGSRGRARSRFPSSGRTR